MNNLTNIFNHRRGSGPLLTHVLVLMSVFVVLLVSFLSLPFILCILCCLSYVTTNGFALLIYAYLMTEHVLKFFVCVWGNPGLGVTPPHCYSWQPNEIYSFSE